MYDPDPFLNVQTPAEDRSPEQRLRVLERRVEDLEAMVASLTEMAGTTAGRVRVLSTLVHGKGYP